jgi:hypothetical protein
MLYLAGDNNLSEEMVLALQDILDEGVHNGDILVAQLDPSGIGLSTQRYVFNGVKMSTQRHVFGGVEKRMELEEYRDKTFDVGETNSGSPEALASFMNWAWKHDPGGQMNCLLILAGHGAGTSEDFLLKDENALDALSIPELKKAFQMVQEAENAAATKEMREPKTRRIHVLGMDACFMNMGEVAYEIREFADILVAAQGLEPSFGWPYRRILKKAKEYRDAFKKPMSPEAVASAIVEEYTFHYSDYDRTAGRSADLSAIRLNRPSDPLKTVVDALKKLTSTLLGKDHKRLLLAHWYAQTYKFDQYVDLVDFCERTTAEFTEDTTVTERCEAVIAAVKDCIIASGVTGFAYQYSNGFSIYFPWAVVSPDYDETHLEFVKESHWDEFLRAHVAATRRSSRYRDGAQKAQRSNNQNETEILDKLMALTEACFSAGDGSTAQDVAKNNVLNSVKALKYACSLADGGSDCERDDDEDIAREVKRLVGFLKLNPGNASDKDRLDRALRAVARTVATTGIPYSDIPREMTRRLLRGTQFSGAKSRYDEDRYDEDRYDEDRFGAGTRFPGDRERAVKNVPPVIGRRFKTTVKREEAVSASQSTVALT